MPPGCAWVGVSVSPKVFPGCGLQIEALVLPALPGPRTASRLNAFTIQPYHPAQGPQAPLEWASLTLPSQATTPMWVS